jgi:hypothetical protein
MLNYNISFITLRWRVAEQGACSDNLGITFTGFFTPSSGKLFIQSMNDT